MSLARRPTVFISSTCYDLKHIRSDMQSFFGSDFGYDVLLSEYDQFPINPALGTIDNCLRVVDERADIFVLIIGCRYGWTTDTGYSVTNLEYLRAKAKGIPIYAFIDKKVIDLLPVWRDNPGIDFKSSVDTPALFEFVEQVRTKDILTLQEFMGYCFIPSTKGQKMLIMVGKGGEGKSRIGIVLRALLGANMNTGSIAKVENSPFARADLEHLLAMVDDDMKLEALSQTNNIKAIVTAELPMDLEKKGQQSYQGDLRVRFLAFGNGTLQALHDRSFGFFRRQIILTVKERDPNRKDDPCLAEKLCSESEGIFLWAMEGLRRLILNDYKFTLSANALENMEEAVADGNNIVDFLKSEGYFRFKADYEVSSKAFYDVYRMWCEDNATNCLSQKTFCSYLKQHADLYNLEYTNKIHIGGGRFARGFLGVELLQKPGW